MHVASLHLARIEQELRAKGVSIQSSLSYQDPVETILDAARQGSGNLMLVCSGLGTARRSVAESVTAGVLASAGTPMLVLGATGVSPLENQGSQGLRVLALAPDNLASATDHVQSPARRAVVYAELLARTFAGQAVELGTRHNPLSQAHATQGQAGPSAATGSVMRVLARLARSQTERPTALLHSVWDDELDAETLACVTRAAADLLVVPLAEDPATRHEQLPAIAYLLAASGVPLLAVP
jgi:hypothetical protein